MNIFLLDYLYETKRPVLMENIKVHKFASKPGICKNDQMIRMKNGFDVKKSVRVH